MLFFRVCFHLYFIKLSGHLLEPAWICLMISHFSLAVSELPYVFG